jgi:hypothetical protein
MAEKELYSFALNNFLNDLLKVFPEIQKAFFFINEDEIFAGVEETSREIPALVVSAFQGVFEKAEILGGVESIIVDASGGAVRLFRYGQYYFVMVTSAKADTQFLNIITRVLIPTVLKLLNRISPTPIGSEAHQLLPTPETIQLESLQLNETLEPSPIEKPEEEFKPENAHETQPKTPSSPELFAVQLIVENIGGLLSQDAVRIDEDALSYWQKTFSGKKIDYVNIETFEGRTAKCKVKPIKDTIFKGKSLIQVPEKIQKSLNIKRGELVRVKPITE